MKIINVRKNRSASVAMSDLDLCPVAVSQDANSNGIEDQPETAIESHLLLLEQNKYCDVTFTFPNLPERLEAHEFCLKARSPVFEKIFRTRKSGKVRSKEIEISESTPSTFQEFLEFIYADKFEVNIAGALHLLQSAQKYKVQPLVRKCEQLFKTEVEVEHSLQIFETARHYRRKDVANRAGKVMVRSLASLLENGSLVNAEEETIIYLLLSDELTVKEVKLFEFILEWGKKQVEPSDDDEMLKAVLKKLIPLIRYTNMTPFEFTKVVSRTEFLSAEEVISVYTYFAGDESVRKGMRIKFNTTSRKSEKMEDVVDFYNGIEDMKQRRQSFGPTPLSECISFKAAHTQIGKRAWSDFRPKDTAITEIRVKWPFRKVQYSELLDESLDFDVIIMECDGPFTDDNVKLEDRFEKEVLNCKAGEEDVIKVEPPVELNSGGTYFVIIEDRSTHFNHPHSYCRSYGYQLTYTYAGMFSPYSRKSEAIVDLEDAHLELKEIQKDNRLNGFEFSTASYPINVIRGIKIGLV